MKIGLISVDSHNFPNLSLMKLSAWHKNKGNDVEWYNIFDQDMVVCATIAVAEAEGNIQVLLDALTTVSAYVNELKHGLKHEKEDLSKLS